MCIRTACFLTTSDQCIPVFFFCSSCVARVDGNNKEVFFFFFAGVRGETGNTRAAAAAKDLVGNCNGFFSKASGAGAKDLFGNSNGFVSNEA